MLAKSLLYVKAIILKNNWNKELWFLNVIWQTKNMNSWLKTHVFLHGWTRVPWVSKSWFQKSYFSGHRMGLSVLYGMLSSSIKIYEHKLIYVCTALFHYACVIESRKKAYIIPLYVQGLHTNYLCTHTGSGLKKLKHTNFATAQLVFTWTLSYMLSCLAMFLPEKM